MMDYFDQQTLEIFWQLFLAVTLGAIIGVERELAHKPAGVRTHALVALGSALFTVLSAYAVKGVPGMDPTRIAAQIVTGVGFMGAGLIVFNESRVRGLTTAAGLWAAAAIGMAVGFRMYMVAAFATMLTLVVFVLFWWFENIIVKRFPGRHHEQGGH